MDDSMNQFAQSGCSLMFASPGAFLSLFGVGQSSQVGIGKLRFPGP